MKLKRVKIKSLRVAFDGYSASGKSLGAKLISKKFKLRLLNSGLLYRFSAFLILKYRPVKEKINLYMSPKNSQNVLYFFKKELCLIFFSVESIFFS